MKVFKIDIENTVMIEKILEIHDKMPIAWDPKHVINPDRRIERILDDPNPQGLWVICDSEKCTPEKTVGMIWAFVYTKSTSKVCNINSLWIAPDLRKSGITKLLTEPCIKWAKKNGADSLECSTHVSNARMREILRTLNFKEEMMTYLCKL